LRFIETYPGWKETDGLDLRPIYQLAKPTKLPEKSGWDNTVNTRTRPTQPISQTLAKVDPGSISDEELAAIAINGASVNAQAH